MFDPITVVLSRYPSQFRPIGAVKPLIHSSGLSGSKLWRFATSVGDLLLRAWPEGAMTEASITRLHAWIAASGHLPFVPQPKRTIDGPTVVAFSGLMWELAPWMPGESSLVQPPRLKHVRAGLKGVASFHSALQRFTKLGPSPGLRVRLNELDNLIVNEFASWDQHLVVPSSAPLRSLGETWLANARRDIAEIRRLAARYLSHVVPLQPCIRDLRPDHLLFEGDSLTGLIDFGAMDVDTVATDLARLLREWCGTDRVSRREALTSYASVRTLSVTESELIPVFERTSDLLIGAHWFRWHFVEKRVFEKTESVAEGLRKSLERLAIRDL